MIKISNNQRGFAAFFVTILVFSVVFAISTGIFILTYGEQKIIKNITNSNKAYYAAESGLEDAIIRVKKSMNLPSNYSISSDGAIASVSVQAPNANTRIITANASMNNVFRKLEMQVSIEAITPEFFYGAQAGDLGITMENNSRIEGTGGASGNIYSNGPISGNNGATITGTVFVATGMEENQNFSVYNSEQIFGQANPVIDVAQSFQPSISNTLVKASIYLRKVGDPEDRTVKILTDNAGSPTETVLASGQLDEDLVGTAFGWVDVIFPSAPNLISGTTYWLMVDAAKDSNDYWVWGKDQNSGYALGQAKYVQDWNSPSPSWSDIAGDLDFKIFMGGQATFINNVIVYGDTYANTITGSKICGNAYYQTMDAPSLNFLNNPTNPTCLDPLTPGNANPGASDPPLKNMPISDSNINQWKADAASGGTYSGNLTVSSSMSYGPKKIDGNLILTSNNKVLTVTGTIYVTGYLDISNGSTIQCDTSYGLNSCAVVVDGWVHSENNGIFRGSGQPGSYIMILSTSNCDGTFSENCTHHDAAMDLHNGAVGAIFYANDGMIYLHNGVEVTELTARRIYLSQGAIIRYEQGLANASFSSGPGGSWQVTSWEEVE